MKTKCYFKDCNHEWDYKGKSKFYITCPNCLRKLNIKKLKELKWLFIILEAGHGMTGLSKVWQGMARLGLARLGIILNILKGGKHE